MELTLLVESQGNAEAGDNVRGALETIGENAGYIKQGLARLRAERQHIGKSSNGQRINHRTHTDQSPRCDAHAWHQQHYAS